MSYWDSPILERYVKHYDGTRVVLKPYQIGITSSWYAMMDRDISTVRTIRMIAALTEERD